MKKLITTILICFLITFTSCKGVVRGFENQLGRNMANSFYKSDFFMPIILSVILSVIVLGLIGLVRKKH